MNISWHGIYSRGDDAVPRRSSLDVQATILNVEKLLAAGMHGMIMLAPSAKIRDARLQRKLEVLKATIEQVRKRIPVLTGVAETTTRLACRFAADAKKIGIDGLMVLPAMIYKSDRARR